MESADRGNAMRSRSGLACQFHKSQQRRAIPHSYHQRKSKTKSLNIQILLEIFLSNYTCLFFFRSRALKIFGDLTRHGHWWPATSFSTACVRSSTACMWSSWPCVLCSQAVCRDKIRMEFASEASHTCCLLAIRAQASHSFWNTRRRSYPDRSWQRVLGPQAPV